VGLFAGQTAQEVQLCPADMCVPLDNNLINARRVQQEGALHADTVGSSAADGEIGIISTLAHADDRALEFLDALALTLFDAHVHTYLVTGTKDRDVRIISSIKIFL
jgi:hypothetical protein